MDDDEATKRRKLRRFRALHGFTTPTFAPIAGAHRSSHSPKVDGATLSLPLSSGERGGVIPQPVNVQPEDRELSINGVREYDEINIRSALLLFDRLDCPSNNIFGIAEPGPPDLQFWDGMQSSRVNLSGNIDHTIFEKAVVHAFQSLNARDSDRWSFVSPHAGFEIPEVLLGGMHGFKLRLEGALPIPDRSVPYDDVLSFKERRKPELQALRHHIEELAISASVSGLSGLQKEIAFEKFSKSVSDYIEAAMSENWLKSLTDLEIRFNWNQAIAGSFNSIPMAILFPALGICEIFKQLGSSVSIESSRSLRMSSESPKAFHYLCLARREI